ncbi:MAG: STAS domain-containing protein [Salinibacter sp.]
MTYERDGDTLTVHFHRDFNLLTARHLRQIVQGDDHVRVDLSNARFVDTEALAVLWSLQNDDVEVTLYDPPDLFHEMVDVLDLEAVFEVEVAASSQ